MTSHLNETVVIEQARGSAASCSPNKRLTSRILLVALAFISFGVALQSYYPLADKLEVSFRYWFWGIPIAVANLRGISHDYTAPMELAEFIQNQGSQLSDETLRVAFNMPISDTKSLAFIPSDDIGYSDYATMAFHLFGLSLSSLHHLYFLLLFVSMCLFLICHHKNILALLALVFALLGFNAIISVLTLDNQFWTVTEPRFAGSLCLIPLMHFLFLVLKPRLDGVSLCTFIGQVMIMIFAIHIRITSVTAILVIFGVCFVSLFIRFFRSRPSGPIQSIRAGLELVWPGLATLGILLALFIYRAHTLNPYYLREGTQFHVIFHSILAGLSVHPDLAQKYHLAISDTIVERVWDYAERHSLIDEEIRTFGFRPTSSEQVTAPRNYREYEKLAKGLVVEIITTESPWRFVELMVWHKPLMLANTYFWVAGISDIAPEKIGLQEHRLMSASERVKTNSYFRLLRMDNVAIWLAALGLVLIASGYYKLQKMIWDWVKVLAGLSAIFLVSLTPAVLTFPSIYVVGDSLIIFACCAYAVLALGAMAVLRTSTLIFSELKLASSEFGSLTVRGDQSAKNRFWKS
jgi:hypothetical protein